LCVSAHQAGGFSAKSDQYDIFLRWKEDEMDVQPTEGDVAEHTAGHLAVTDVIYVALAIAVILFGNMALVRAMDVALDSLAR
jgi:hypothetical protein